VTEVYSVIEHLEQQDFTTAQLCKILSVSRSAYYAWHQGEASMRQQEDERLKPMIRTIFKEHKRRYGSRRISIELGESRNSCGRLRTKRLMSEMNLVAIQPRSFKPRTTESRHTLGYNKNLLLEAPPPDGINQLWVGDITYVPLAGSGAFLYLAILMDRYSRRIIGWDLQGHMKEPLVLSALQAAIRSRSPRPGLTHHTDRGGQYAGKEYRKMLDRGRMQQSMSRANDCYDNAFMESCFGTIKAELEMAPYKHERIAKKEIHEYIRYYNTRRKHSSLSYMSPDEFERIAS